MATQIGLRNETHFFLAGHWLWVGLFLAAVFFALLHLPLSAFSLFFFLGDAHTL